MKRLGPVRYFWGKKRRFISAWLKGHDDAEWGWEWGSDGHDGIEPPVLFLRLLGLTVIGIGPYGDGWELHLLGFWWFL